MNEHIRDFASWLIADNSKLIEAISVNKDHIDVAPVTREVSRHLAHLMTEYERISSIPLAKTKYRDKFRIREVQRTVQLSLTEEDLQKLIKAIPDLEEYVEIEDQLKWLEKNFDMIAE